MICYVYIQIRLKVSQRHLIWFWKQNQCCLQGFPDWYVFVSLAEEKPSGLCKPPGQVDEEPLHAVLASLLVPKQITKQTTKRTTKPTALKASANALLIKMKKLSESAWKMIGNAVPPMLAQQMGVCSSCIECRLSIHTLCKLYRHVPSPNDVLF